MTDFPNKIVSIVLVFLMLVVAPITWSYVREDMVAERQVLNEVASFIDKVTDKSTITQSDIDALYLAVNSSGGTYDVRVQTYLESFVPNMIQKNGTIVQEGVRPIYTPVEYIVGDESTVLNKGTLVKVTVEEIGTSPLANLLWALIKLDKGRSDFSLVGKIR